MSSKINLKKIQRSSSKISKNISKKLRNNKVFNFIIDYKYPFIFVAVLSIFIGKNIFLLGSYASQISALEEEVKVEEAKTTQLKEDIKYYNTDEFVYRYALENLNMRPTKKSKLIHLDVNEQINSDEDNNDDIDTNDEHNNQNDSNVESNSNETTNDQASDSENTGD